MKISIIIPCFNEAGFIKKTIENCINLQGDFEIIVVDGGSQDSTIADIQDFQAIKLLSSGKGRARQMNFGAKKAQGEILLFLHADTLLPEKTYTLIRNQFQQKNFIGGSFRLKLDTKHPLLEFYTWCSRYSLEFFTYGDHGIFITRKVFEEIAGYREMPFMEDIEIQKRLRRKGKFKKLDDYVITSGRRFQKNGTFKQLCIDVIIVCLYKIGIPPAKLKPFYTDHG